MAGETYLVAREETREVLTYPSQLTRVPGAKTWVKGLANVRGALLPVIDLRQFLGSGATPTHAQYAPAGGQSPRCARRPAGR